MKDTFNITLSSLDEQRFGVRTAKSVLVAPDDLPAVLDFCRSNQVTLAIVRCSTHDLGIVQGLEQAGFFLTDTLVYYKRDLQKTPVPNGAAQVIVRSVMPGDEQAVGMVAAQSFQGYLGHYHADPRLNTAQCDEVYVDWAIRSCLSRDVADEVLIAEVDGAIVGFATLRLNDADEGEGVLFGVAPTAQGKGIYRSFMIEGMKWCLAQGASKMLVSTQVTNIAVQKVWTRLSFEPSHSYYTLHKWSN